MVLMRGVPAGEGYAVRCSSSFLPGVPPWRYS